MVSFFIINILLCLRSSNRDNFFIRESKKGGAVPGKVQTGLVQAFHMNAVKVPKRNVQPVLFQP